MKSSMDDETPPHVETPQMNSTITMEDIQAVINRLPTMPGWGHVTKDDLNKWFKKNKDRYSFDVHCDLTCPNENALESKIFPSGYKYHNTGKKIDENPIPEANVSTMFTDNNNSRWIANDTDQLLINIVFTFKPQLRTVNMHGMDVSITPIDLDKNCEHMDKILDIVHYYRIPHELSFDHHNAECDGIILQGRSPLHHVRINEFKYWRYGKIPSNVSEMYTPPSYLRSPFETYTNSHDFNTGKDLLNALVAVGISFDPEPSHRTTPTRKRIKTRMYSAFQANEKSPASALLFIETKLSSLLQTI